ncbi:MAG: hypothetical protein IT559_03155 [Alphaproteobacteria bacterium]|nr:hypothetical protein [Alphaproteobacteria bacterium]
MSKAIQITQKLGEAGVLLVGNLAQDATDTNKFYAFVETKQSKDGKQEPSNYKLRKISESFAEDHIFILFIIVQDDRENIQASLKSALFRFFPEIVRNVFVSSEKNDLYVWVEPKKVLTENEKNDIQLKINEVLEVLEIKSSAVKFTSSENLPTKTVCLNLIRLKAPITQAYLELELVHRGFHIPNGEWLSNILDNLRKSGLLLRSRNAKYALTLEGLKNAGTRKNRRSPDVVRALDIAKHVQ